MHKITVSILFLLLMVFANSTAFANSTYLISGQDSITARLSEISVNDTIINLTSSDTASLHINQKEKALQPALPLTDKQKKKKLITALFAFPFPFGFVAAHRVMLGTKPWIPIVYVATFGGCFGLLPLIDFIVILNSKDIEQYENNPNLFMWIK